MIIDISKIIESVPSIRPYLSGRSALISCEVKAVDRDPAEPGAEDKKRFERRLQRLIRARFTRQMDALISDMEKSGFKTITVPGAYVPDDPQEYNELVKLFVDAIVAGVVMVEDDVNLSLDDVLTNRLAFEYAKKYVTEWLAGLDATTQAAVHDAIGTFIEKPGTTLADVSNMIEPYFGSSRAFKIAVTEITRAFAQGNQQAGQMLKQEYPTMTVSKRWYTNRDDRVCPICGPLDNKKVGVDENFSSNGREIDNPPAHVNCRCWTGVTIDV